MNENHVVSTRVNDELLNWLNKQAITKKAKISDLVRDAILMYKEATDIPEDMLFSNMFSTQADKSAIFTYRLLEAFIRHTNTEASKIVTTALEIAKKDFAEFRINAQQE